MDEVTTALRQQRRFATLPAADLDMLARAFLVEEHEDGHVFLKEGQRVDGAYLILSGEVAVTRRRGAATDEIHRHRAGELFGLVALVDDKRRSATCRAVGNVRTASLPQSAFQLLLHAQAPAASAIQHAVADQLCADFRHLQGELREEIERHR